MRKFIYYFLNCTWGIIMTFIGFCAAGALRLLGYKPEWYGPCLHFKVGQDWGGVSLGLVIITDDTPYTSTLKHEFGHTLQNAVLGPFFVFLVAIPSFIRYWIFTFRERKGKRNPPYDSIWFEGTASYYGRKYFIDFL